MPEKAIRLSKNTVPPGSNCYRLRHEKGCLVWKPLILQRTFFQQKAGCVFVNILRTGCRRPPFVAATLSAFTVSQQRWDCDIPTVTLALPLATFDQSVFLSPYPYYNFKSAFWPVLQKTIEINRLTLSSPLLRPDLGESAKPDTKKWTRLSPCPICTSNLLIFIQS